MLLFLRLCLLLVISAVAPIWSQDNSAPATQELANGVLPLASCDTLRSRFISLGCLTQESLRCRLVNFRLRFSPFNPNPRCGSPCELYGAPPNRMCQASCSGTVVPDTICAAGQVCCIPGSQPPQTQCRFRCQSSFSCIEQDPSGTCPYAHDVCCRRDIFGGHFNHTRPVCSSPSRCTSPFNCGNIDIFSRCSSGFDVCCRAVSNNFPARDEGAPTEDDQVPSQRELPSETSELENNEQPETTSVPEVDSQTSESRREDDEADSLGTSSDEINIVVIPDPLDPALDDQTSTTAPVGNAIDDSDSNDGDNDSNNQEPQPCPYECRSSLSCAEVDSSYTCGGLGFDVCCKRPDDFGF